MLQAAATETAIDTTATSLNISVLDGSKLGGGSIEDKTRMGEGGSEEGDEYLGFLIRLLGVEAIVILIAVTCLRELVFTNILIHIYIL